MGVGRHYRLVKNEKRDTSRATPSAIWKTKPKPFGVHWLGVGRRFFTVFTVSCFYRLFCRAAFVEKWRPVCYNHQKATEGGNAMAAIPMKTTGALDKSTVLSLNHTDRQCVKDRQTLQQGIQTSAARESRPVRQPSQPVQQPSRPTLANVILHEE